MTDIEERLLLSKIPRGFDKWDAYHREIERRVEISNRIPEGLLVPCEVPELNGETYADINRDVEKAVDKAGEL